MFTATEYSTLFAMKTHNALLVISLLSLLKALATWTAPVTVCDVNMS